MVIRTSLLCLARRQPEPRTDRYWSTVTSVQGVVPLVSVAVSSPLPSRSGRQLALSGSSAEDVLALSWWFEQCSSPGRDHQVAR